MSNNNIRYSYVYLTTNKINGKNYVGQHHGYLDDKYLGSGKLILKAIDKYGANNFYKEIIAICNSQKELNILEDCYIILYKSIGKAEYNLSKGGLGGTLSEESRSLISKNKRKYYETPEGQQLKEHLRDINTGKRHSDSTKKLLSEKNAIYWNSPEGQKEKEINSKRHKGRKQSKEEIEKRRQSNIGKKRTSEQNKRNSEHMKELWQNSKYRQHMMDAHKKLKWWTNGVTEVQAYECPIGFKHGRSPKSMSNVSPRARRYYNNGIIEVMQFECPEGFVPGRCPKLKRAISKGTKKQ